LWKENRHDARRKLAHRVPPYRGKTDEDFAAYQKLINSTDWRYCDNPPIPGRIAIPKIVPKLILLKRKKL